MQPSVVQKFSRWSLLAAVLLLPVVGYAASLVKFGTAYVEGWLPTDSASRVGYRKFVAEFGEDQYLIVSWPDCRLSDPKLVQLVDRLRQIAVDEPNFNIIEVQDSLSAVQRLAADRRDIDEADAAKVLRGHALGKDGTAFISLKLGDATLEQRSRLIKQIESNALSIGVPADALVLAGEPYQVHIIDESSRTTMKYYVAPSSVLALGFAWLCLRSWSLTAIVFGFAGVGQVIGLALIAVFFGEMSAVMVVLPTLIFMLTLSAAIHLVNYYRDAGAARSRFAGAHALRMGIWPCGLAALTTVFGFASLAVSQLAPVWQFGCLASLGLSLSTLVLLCVFPAATELPTWLLGRIRRRAGSRVAKPNQPALEAPERSAYTVGEPWHLAVASVTRRWASVITIVGIGLLIVSSFGIQRLQTSTEFGDMFPSQSRAMRNLSWVNEKLGPINSLEMLVTFPDGSELDLLDRTALIQNISEKLRSVDHVYNLLSATSFLPPIPDGMGTRTVIRRAVLRRTMETNYEVLQANHMLAAFEDRETWRITVRVLDLRGDNYAEICDELLAEANSVLPGMSEATAADVKISGLRTVIEVAHATLLKDLAGSFATAFLLITPVMMLIVRGFLSGLIVMVPNVLPVVLVFGTMGWLGVRLDVASILTASVALGIAVDDTLHFMSWFLRGRRLGKDAAASVEDAITACARPMLHTTVICAGAMLPFFFSDFLPTSKFALLMILILVGAIVGDLILLPAILLSPLGKLVGRVESPS